MRRRDSYGVWDLHVPTAIFKMDVKFPELPDKIMSPRDVELNAKSLKFNLIQLYFGF